jgi:Uma2 family endonuclease
MATATTTLPAALTLDEYLQTAYHPDCDFVDGNLEERNVGTFEHGHLQLQLGFWFISHQREWEIRVASELRIRVSSSSVRLPDVAVIRNDRNRAEQVRTTPPLIAIEILSPQDRMPRVLDRLDDFLAMGVPNVWLLDPVERVAYTYSASGLKLVRSAQLFVPDSPIHLQLAELFATLD